MDHTALEQSLDWSSLIGRLRDWYKAGQVETPARQVLTIQHPDGTEGVLPIRCRWVFVDHRDGAIQAGDLAQPLADAVIGMDHILGDLGGLCQGKHCGRASETEFTLFKSAGMALQDLAAASLARDHSASG
jgi:hypothetical protein